MTGVASRNPLIDRDSCAREPIHLIGHIQSHGLLLALSEPDFIVRQVSANVGALLGIEASAVLGKSLRAVLGSRQFDIFRARLRTDDLSPASSLRVVLGSRELEMNGVAHRHDDVLIVEFELVPEALSMQPSELAANFQILLTRMERAADILEYCRVAAGEMQRLSGFDRVMVYRFDAHWNGEVIAEHGRMADPTEASQDSYLGLRFPASDIPIQARQLFLTNAVRAIADVASTPVPIVPQIGPLTGRALDLSHTFLRSASLLHVEYLRNMGVRSSLTVSIVVEERLWGMIACHHHAPRPIDCLTRSVCEMVARNLALQVGLWDANATRRSRLRSHDLLDDYADRREGSASPADAESLAAAQFVDLLDADGVIARIDGVVSVHGVAPSEKALHPIIRKLRTLALRGVASSDTLRALDDSAESYAREASGALYIALNERTADYLLFVRRELIETVTWAGNPDKSVSADTAGRLHPRKSFAAWQQTVHGQARPWSDVDIENARALRGQLRHLQDARRLRE